MRMMLGFVVAAVMSTALVSSAARGESIDGRVVKIDFPVADVSLGYVETPGVFSVELDAGSIAVRGQKFYLGDGKIAVELEAHETKGIFFQRTEHLNQGFVFKKYDVVKVRPGYKRAGELKPGEVYVVFPGVKFELPTK